MPPEVRAALGIALGLAFIVCGLGAAICHQMAGYQPRSNAAQQVMEHEARFERYYDPEDHLLSDRGLRLRRRAGRLGRTAGWILVLIVAWAIWLT